FKKAQETDKAYILSLHADRLLAPFLREAGLPLLAKSYGNWEATGLDGHIGGHYLSALANMYAATGDKRVGERLTYTIDWLEKCQQKDGDGYVGGIPGGKKMWQAIADGKINAGSFSLNDKWVPLYNIHKLFAGLADAYLLTGNSKAKQVLIKLSDWFLRITGNLSDEQLQTILRSEHGGMNEVFADIAEISGDQKYLVLAKRLSHKAILQPLLEKRDALNGQHANTQIPKVIGYLRIAQMDGDKGWLEGARFFWNTVTKNRTISIGGNSVREHFHPANDFSSMIETREGPETCNTYNMLKLSKLLFASAPSSAYMDYYERAVSNHILSSQHPNGGFVYFTPIRPQHYRVYSSPQESFWCCVGTGLENHGKYGEMIYAHNNKDLFINLFIPSVLNWKENGLVLKQETT
ncbi:MAG: glycosyl hydrolase, partial [Chitinophagaceae bacterium]